MLDGPWHYKYLQHRVDRAGQITGVFLHDNWEQLGKPALEVSVKPRTPTSRIGHSPWEPMAELRTFHWTMAFGDSMRPIIETCSRTLRFTHGIPDLGIYGPKEKSCHVRPHT